MEDIWFTSDTHFHHKRIIEFCPNTRSGSDADEMTELMIYQWNSLVKPGDRVYHAGDFSFGSKDQTSKILDRLNGSIHITLGNHDRILDQEYKHKFATVSYYKNFRIADHKIIMMHYPIESWDGKNRGYLHFHGHLHGDDHRSCRKMFNRIDIGVDTRKDKLMAPFHFDEVLANLKIQNEGLGDEAVEGSV